MSKNKQEIRTQSQARELRVATSADGKDRVLSGYAVVWNSPSLPMGFIETIAPYAFTDSLRDNPGVLMFRDHKPELLLGNTTSGTLALAQDDTGLKFSCTLPKTQVAADLIASVERRDIDKMSFGFSVPPNGDQWSSDNTGTTTRVISTACLGEVSIVSMPAYTATTVNLRSCPIELRGKIRSASDDEDEENDLDCTCTCAACMAGDCDGCTDENCDCDGCDCNQSDDEDRSILSKSEVRHLQMRLALAKLR